jgi:hypothetical protein
MPALDVGVIAVVVSPGDPTDRDRRYGMERKRNDVPHRDDIPECVQLTGVVGNRSRLVLWIGTFDPRAYELTRR